MIQWDRGVRKRRKEFPKISSLDYSPTCETLTGKTLQKTVCFLAKSLDSSLGKAFEDFSRAS
jgi:hypothetical protein